MKPSDLKKQAEEMIARGEMPSLDEVLDAIAAAREKFAPKIEAARKAAQGKRNRER